VRTDRRIIFRGRLTRHGIRQPGAGCDDQWSVGADENRAERLDHAAVVLTVRREFREVVIEGQVDEAVRAGSPSLEAVQVFNRPAMDLGTRSSQRHGLFIRTAETEDLMACGDQLLDDGRPDESGGTGNEYTHEKVSMFSWRQMSVQRLSW
jgi:hypothetical protein